MKGHIQKRGKKSWRLKFDLPPDVTTRKRRTRYLTVHGTKKDAEAKLAEVLTAVNQICASMGLHSKG